MNNWSKRKKLFMVLSVLIILIAGYYVVQVARFFAVIRDLNVEQRYEYEYEYEAEEAVLPERSYNYPRTNILLLGIDARSPGGRSRTDTMIILSFDENTGKAALLSIPRDSRVNIPGIGLDKINHAHAFGGVPLAIKAVESFLDIPVHYFARINFKGFEQIIDSLGGVTINVETHVANNSNVLQPGEQRLNGAQALTYVRDRRGDNDIERVKRQQKFLKAMAKETVRVKAIALAPRLLADLGENFRTNMPVMEMIRVANLLIRIDLDTIPQGVIPGEGQMIGGVSYWIVDTTQTEKLLVELELKCRIAS